VEGGLNTITRTYDPKSLTEKIIVQIGKSTEKSDRRIYRISAVDVDARRLSLTGIMMMMILIYDLCSYLSGGYEYDIGLPLGYEIILSSEYLYKVLLK